MANDWNGSERRKSERRNIPCKIYVFTPEKLIIPAMLEDISEVGVRVGMFVRLEVDSDVDLEIFMEESPVRCRGRVVWIKHGSVAERPKGKGELIYHTGIEITSRENPY
jgi:hypothetical protein